MYVVRYRLSNDSPVFTSEPQQEAEAGRVYSYAATATDPDSDPLEYALLEGPAGMSVAPASGVVEWREPALGEYAVELEVTDDAGGSARQAWTLRVQLANRLPEFVSEPVTLGAADTPYLYRAQATDPEGAVLLYTLAAAPVGMSIAAESGTVAWPTPVQGSHSVHIVATDPRGGIAEQAWTLRIREQNHAPEFGAGEPPPAIVDLPYLYTPPLRDADGDAILLSLQSGPLGLSVADGAIHWRPATAGSTEVQLLATDALGASTEQRYTLTTDYPAGDLPPQWGEFALEYTVALGQTLSLQLPVIDESPLRYYAHPLPLPAGMVLESATGFWSYTPEAPGSYTLTLGATDERFRSERTVTLIVPTPDPTAPTHFQGRLLDANSMAQGTVWPIVGATVSILHTQVSARTDAEGNFTLSGIPEAESYILDLDPSSARPAPLGLGYAGFRERISLHAHVLNTEPRPFTLPRLAAESRTQINPLRDTMVMNEELDIELQVPAGMALAEDGSPYNGELWISEVPRGLAPAALPEFLDPGLLITIQPVGVRFAQPVPITFSNPNGYPPGAELDLWSIDPEQGEFVIVGTLRVSSDGERLETVSGGIRAADWHARIPNPPGSPTPDEPPLPDEDNKCDCPNEDAGSSANLQDGRLGMDISLPTYRSLQRNRGVRLVYQSSRAHVRPLVSINSGVQGGGSIVPQSLSLYLDVGGVQGDSRERHVDLRREQLSVGTREGIPMQLTQSFDAHDLQTGYYPYTFWVAANFPAPDARRAVSAITRTRRQSSSATVPVPRISLAMCLCWQQDLPRRSSFRTRSSSGGSGGGSTTVGGGRPPVDLPDSTPPPREVGQVRGSFEICGDRVATRITSDVLVHNEVRSPFGAGWMLDGFYQLKEVRGEGRLLVSPTGSPLHYRYDAKTQRYSSPRADWGELSLEEDGSFMHRAKNGERMYFDAEGRMQAHADRNGNRTRYEYRGSQLQSIIDPTEQVTTLRYRHGKLYEVEDPASRISRLEHDARGNLTAVQYPDGSRESYAYDNEHKIESRKDERGNAYQYEYDMDGRLRAVHLPDGSERRVLPQQVRSLIGNEPGEGAAASPASPPHARFIRSIYVDARGHQLTRYLDSHGRAIQTIDALGRVTNHARTGDSEATQTERRNGSVANRTFDEQGNVLSQTEQFNGATTRYTYDEYSLLTSLTNPRGNTMRMERDAQGNVVRSVNAVGHVTSIRYDSRGLVEEAITPNGLIHTYTYNEQGLPIRIVETPPAGSPGSVRTSRLQHHATGLIAEIQMPDEVVQTLEYDVRNRPVSTQDSLGRSRQMSYDAYGNVIREEIRDAEGMAVLSRRSAYDSRNRLMERASPHTNTTESVMRYHLDAESNRTGYTDPNGAQDQMEYDPINRQSRNVHRLDGVTEYAYDELDRLIKVQASNGVVTEYAYDDLGRRIEERSPDRGTMRYTYDLANNVVSVTEGRGIASRYSYDALERVTEIRYPNTHAGKDETVHYTYDSCFFGKGQLCVVQDESGTTRYRYDAWGNRVEQRHTELGVEYVSRYVYDEGNRVVQQTLPSGRVVEYSRDVLRRVSAVRAIVNGTWHSIVSDLHYRADDRMEYCRYGNELEDRRSYDLQGRLTRQVLSATSGLEVHKREYVYDANGNIVELSVDGLTRRYDYDALDRLVKDGGVNPAVRFSYDLNDNRLRRDLEDQSEKTEYFYQEGSNKLAVSERFQRLSVPVEPEQQRHRIKYNDAGRVWRVYAGEVLVAEYIYNAQGQRTRKVMHEGTEQTVTVYHYGLEDELLTETDVAGNPVRDYVWVRGRPTAQIDVSTEAEELVYLYTDHLMTPRLATNRSGVIVWSWEGSVFGETVADKDPDRNGHEWNVQLRFPGQYKDEETGWHYNWNRYYDPEIGRYISSDLTGLDGGMNTYIYVEGNPVSKIDPNGNLGVFGALAIVGFATAVGVFVLGRDEIVCISYSWADKGKKDRDDRSNKPKSNRSRYYDKISHCPPCQHSCRLS